MHRDVRFPLKLCDGLVSVFLYICQHYKETIIPRTLKFCIDDPSVVFLSFFFDPVVTGGFSSFCALLHGKNCLSVAVGLGRNKGYFLG